MVSRRLLLGSALAALVIISGVAAVYSAQQRAVRAEETHVATQLETATCLDDWGVNEGTETKSAAVTGVSPFGVRVTVSIPYAYSVDRDGDPIFADTASEAVYEVTLLNARRVSGDDISPC
jgi:hypothetical protein